MKLLHKTATLLLLAACAPIITLAQVDSDIPVNVTADCFSICLATVNVKGVQGDVSIGNLFPVSVSVAATVKVQCNGVDVPGATQSLGPATVAAKSTATLPYSIAFAPVGGCAYTVVTTGTNSSIPTRSTTVSTTFLANCMDQPCGSTGCTLTLGYWKNHPENWPVTTLTLGTTTYTQAQLISILKQPVKGNGLVSLSHQLIAAKLNVANGASGSVIAAAIASADSAIGSLVVPPVGSGSLSTSSVGNLVTTLDQYNNGLLTGGPGHCAN